MFTTDPNPNMRETLDDSSMNKLASEREKLNNLFMDIITSKNYAVKKKDELLLLLKKC